jgi:hypothetical protein
MKSFCIALLLTWVAAFANAQSLSPADRKLMLKREDSLKMQCRKILLDTRLNERVAADSFFTRLLVRTLKTPYSFQYVFDSLNTISIQYPSDSSFRIFTWQLVISDNLTRQHGAIQMRTTDGSLRLFPLIDKSDVTERLNDTVGNNRGWIGAVYYKIITKKQGLQTYYTLLGYDENNIRSTRKYIEVLTFSNDEPIFGSRIFSFEKDKVFKSAQSRYVMEFKKQAGPRLNYDPEMDMILMEHLSSESGEPNKKWTLIPDGDYEGFKWENGKWMHIEKIFDYVTPEVKEGELPQLKGDAGTKPADEYELEGAGAEPAVPATEKPAPKPKPVKPKPKPAPVKKN